MASYQSMESNHAEHPVVLPGRVNYFQHSDYGSIPPQPSSNKKTRHKYTVAVPVALISLFGLIVLNLLLSPPMPKAASLLPAQNLDSGGGYGSYIPNISAFIPSGNDNGAPNKGGGNGGNGDYGSYIPNISSFIPGGGANGGANGGGYGSYIPNISSFIPNGNDNGSPNNGGPGGNTKFGMDSPGVCLEMQCSTEVGVCGQDIEGCQKVTNCLFDKCMWQGSCDACFKVDGLDPNSTAYQGLLKCGQSNHCFKDTNNTNIAA